MRAKSTASEQEKEKLKILFFKDLLKPEEVAKQFELPCIDIQELKR